MLFVMKERYFIIFKLNEITNLRMRSHTKENIFIAHIQKRHG